MGKPVYTEENCGTCDLPKQDVASAVEQTAGKLNIGSKEIEVIVETILDFIKS